MPARPLYLGTDVLQRARDLEFRQRADRDIWKLGFDQQAESDITGLSKLIEPPQLELQAAPEQEPLPIVVSDRPDALALQRQAQERQMPQQPMMQPQQQPPAAASGAPVVMPTGGEQAATPSPRPMAASSSGGNHGEIDNSSRESFVRTAYPYMLEAAGGDQNLAELMLAKAISENGSIGTGRPFWANNFSGIKGEGDAGSVEADTWEDYGNGPVNIRDRFAAYSTPQAGMAAFMQFLRDNSRYHPALARYEQTRDASQLFRDIRAAGYATDPIWAEKVEDIRATQVAPVVRGQSGQDMPRLSLNAAPADAPGRAAPPAPAGVSSAPAGAPPAPWEMAGAQDGGAMMLKENDETAAFLPGDGGTAPAPEYDPRQYDEGQRESRPAPILPTDPTVSDPAYTQSPTGMTYGPIQQGDVQGPPAPAQTQMDRYVPTYQAQAAQVAPTMPSPAAGAVQAGIDAAVESYNDPFYQAGPQPPRWVKIVSDAMQAFGAESAKNVARSLGVTDEEWFNVFGYPISRVDVAGFAGGVLADPTNYVGMNMADPLVTVARGAVRDFAPEAVKNVGRAVGNAAREGAEALGRGLQGVGREVAGGLMDLNPGMAPRMAEGGPGIGRAFSDGGRPQQRTVEWLAEQIDYTKRVLDDLDPNTEGELIGQVQDRLARLQGEWVDAVNARRALEPRIRSEVGRRVNELPIDERTASDYAGIGRERVSPEAGIPRTVDDTPRSPGLNSAPSYNGRGAGIGAQAAADVGASLQGGVVGAAAGYGMPADSEEQRRRNALTFGGAGMIGMPVAGRVVGRGMRGAGAGTRAGIVPPHVADQMADTFPVRVPQDPKVIRAIESIGGTVDPERGVTINVTRAQGPQAAGQTATRGGVFYEAVPEGGRSNFVRGSDDPTGTGGSQVIPARPTRFRSPLIVSDAPGGTRGFDEAMEQMGSVDPLLAEAEQALQRAVDEGNRLRSDGWKNGWTPEVDAKVSAASAEAFRLSQEVTRIKANALTAEGINNAIRQARRAGPEGSEARAQALKAVVAKYGGDPELIEPLLRVRGADASESEWAIRENILAAHARRNGYDGVVTVQADGGASAAEIMAHPKVVAAQKALDEASAAVDAADDATGNVPDALAIAYDRAAMAFQKAKQEAFDELSRRTKITELIDVREGANPTPGAPNPKLLEAEAEKNRTLSKVRRLEASLFSQLSPSERSLLNNEGERAVMRRVPELEPQLTELEQARRAAVEADTNFRNVKASEPETVTESGYTVRSDIPRPPGAQWAGLPFDPTSAALGGAAGAMSEGEDGEQGDPLRTAGAMAVAGIMGRKFPGMQRALDASQRRAAAMAARGIKPLNPLQWAGEAVKTAGYSSMIGIRTATVNMAGNLFEPIWGAPKEGARAVARAVERKNASALREPGEMFFGALTGLSETGGEMLQALQARGRYASNPDQPRLSERTINPVGHAVVSGLEFGGRVFSGVPDAFFGTIARRAGERRTAAQIATDAGLKGDAWKARVEQILNDRDEIDAYMRTRASLAGQASPNALMPGQPAAMLDPDRMAAVEKMVKDGGAHADDMTYRNKLGTWGEGFKNFVTFGNTPVIGTLTAPFVTTPWNARTRMLEKTPIGFGMNTYNRPGTARTRFDKWYDAALGTPLLIVLAMGPAAAGRVTGSGPSDPNERKTMEENGWKPYSTLVTAPDGNEYYIPNRNIGNWGLALNVIGEIHDEMAYQKPGRTPRDQIESVARRVGRIMQDDVYAGGLVDLVGLLTEPDQTGMGWAAQQAARLTPYAATARDIGTSMDPNERERPEQGDTWTGMGTELRQRWQQATGQRSDLDPKTNAKGEPMPNEQAGWRAFAPRATQAKNDPIIKEILANDAQLGKTREAFTVTATGSDAPDGGVGTGKVKLNRMEQAQWKRHRWEYIQNVYAELMADQEFQSAPESIKQKIWRGQMTSAGKYADGMIKEQWGDAEYERRVNEAFGNLRARAS